MLNVGQEIDTKYGAGEVICIGRCKPHVYVRLHSRPNCVYVFNFTDLLDSEIKNFAPYSSAQAQDGGQQIAPGLASDEFGQHQGEAW
jgi:hypothetical protein